MFGTEGEYVISKTAKFFAEIMEMFELPNFAGHIERVEDDSVTYRVAWWNNDMDDYCPKMFAKFNKLYWEV
jgi:hypothetical protein